VSERERERERERETVRGTLTKADQISNYQKREVVKKERERERETCIDDFDLPRAQGPTVGRNRRAALRSPRRLALQ
jgi:hypothetical protein